MAPEPVDLNTIDDLLKDVIQHLYAIQACVHGYLGPETQQELVRKIKTLTTSLTTLSRSAAALPVLVPPEIIAYVEEGRNPDIYTREFVELVQRGNAYVRGKSEALRAFRDALAEEVVGEWPECGGWVRGVVGGA
ncbi:RNA polymerase II mediator complex subunit [Xylographa carneopallida]|nr:RNA polymerase II mediator complex subunit [Xylographa carneopallida]